METQSQNPIISKSYEDLIESTALVHVATIGPHGEPQNNPAWFGWDGEQLTLPVGPRQNYQNLNRDPRVALSTVDPENPYRYLEVRGEVDHVEEDPKLNFINSVAKKYLEINRYPYHQPGDERVVIFVRPGYTTQMEA